ncbi:MAG TPA: hypothetical protein VGG33_29310 [Polyangia bacterium]
MKKMNMRGLLQWGCAVAVMTAAPAVFANQVPDPDPNQRVPLGDGTPTSQLPPPRSDHDPRPAVPAASVPATGVTQQAGIGGTQAYGRAGVLELGGSGGFSAAPNYTRLELSPSSGLFILDNVEMSLLTAFNYFRVGGDDNAVGGPTPESSATEFKALIEPSFHIPFSQSAFGFLGLGAGINYVTGGGDAGFALQPRLGGNFLVGRSGVLTPSVTVAYSTVDAIRTQAGTVLAVQTSYGVNIGYTVMW